MTLLKSMRRPAALALLCAAGAAQANPFGIFDPRSVAMGGTGVASGTAGNASYFNPALLAAPAPRDKFAMEIPIVAARAADREKLLDNVDRLDATGQDLTNAINQYNAAVSANPANAQAAAGPVAAALESFRLELNNVNNKSMEGNIFAAPLTIGVPGKSLGWGIYAGARADFGVQTVYASTDDTTLQNFRNDALTCSNTGNCLPLATNWGATLSDPTLDSRVNLRGAVIAEAGVSLAHQFESLDGLAIGITPKAQKVATLDYSVSPQQAEISFSQGRKDYTGTNFDIGFAKDQGNGFKIGVVGKNMIARSYETALGNTIELKPQYRAGISHQSSWTTFAIDVDLKENAPLAFDKPTRYAAAGLELDFRFLKLRAGYRTDLTHNYKGLPSVGVGLSVFGIHVDAAVAARGREEVIAAIQAGFRY